jgi:hypothetical protein
VRRGELSYCLFTSGEPSQHRAPGAVAEGSEDTVEAVGLFNHEVEYIGCYVSVNRLVELYPAEVLALDLLKPLSQKSWSVDVDVTE